MKIRIGLLCAMWMAIVAFSVMEAGLAGLAAGAVKASFWCLVFNRLWPTWSEETKAVPMVPKPMKGVVWRQGAKQTLYR